MAKRLLGSLLALVLLPTQGMASITNAELEEFELSLWQVRTDFHMLTIMAGSNNYATDLDRSISRAQSALSSLDRDAEGSEERALITALQKDWQQLEGAASANTVADQGFTDAYTIRNINELPAIMVEKIEGFDAPGQGKYDDVRELAAFLQRMTSEYLNVIADPAGGMGVGSDEGRLEFKDAVPRFEKMLKAAKQQHAGDDAMSRALNQVGLKWQFIRESMVKFYENAVPFLIYRYTTQMVETLDQAIALASTSIEKPTFGPVD